ncbi:hypothetical protein SAMN05892883_0389 [Jatrophihabitans sp. GAS493]|uniref:LmeA family phospholipid-binding protein n=1 Tax=Jatrophihabitans sp. GAS493 TaxID=1907575 RepID=UPI000BC0ACD8|nr:DUF2993 domain-containing protein [Jatrophihabitans sp. GAS493]SOD70739.1 hypothetical protein SAMN05892883_0389 [Jatrophihabitans sp. GAS493]
MHRGLKWLIGIVVVLGLLLVAADFVGKSVLQDNASKSLATFSQFQDTPDVTLHGFPFLTQAISGDYKDIEITSNSVTVGEIRGASMDAHLKGAKLPLSQLRSNSITEVPVDEVEGYVVAPYAELERLSKVNGLKLSAQGSELVVQAPVTVPVLGSVTINATGGFDVVNGTLKLDVHSLKVGGLDVPSAVLPLATSALNSTIEIPPLPYGLHLTSTTPTPNGLQLNGAGTDVVLKQQP